MGSIAALRARFEAQQLTAPAAQDTPVQHQQPGLPEKPPAPPSRPTTPKPPAQEAPTAHQEGQPQKRQPPPLPLHSKPVIPPAADHGAPEERSENHWLAPESALSTSPANSTPLSSTPSRSTPISRNNSVYSLKAGMTIAPVPLRPSRTPSPVPPGPNNTADEIESTKLSSNSNSGSTERRKPPAPPKPASGSTDQSNQPDQPDQPATSDDQVRTVSSTKRVPPPPPMRLSSDLMPIDYRDSSAKLRDAKPPLPPKTGSNSQPNSNTASTNRPPPPPQRISGERNMTYPPETGVNHKPSPLPPSGPPNLPERRRSVAVDSALPPALPPRVTATTTPSAAAPALPERQYRPPENGRSSLGRSSTVSSGSRPSRYGALPNEARSLAAPSPSVSGQTNRSLGRSNTLLPSSASSSARSSPAPRGDKRWVAPAPPQRINTVSTSHSGTQQQSMGGGHSGFDKFRDDRASSRTASYDSDEGDGEELFDEVDRQVGGLETSARGDHGATHGFRHFHHRSNTTSGGSSPVPSLPPNRALAEHPDGSRANKRAPDFVPRQRVASTVHTINSFAAFGYRLCVGTHVVKVYDMTLGDNQPILTCDPRTSLGLDFKGKDPKITSLAYRAGAEEKDEGRYLWCGTGTGHLWELDTMTGKITDVKANVHSTAITHIFRYAEWMVTIEESGNKIHVFGPFLENEQVAQRHAAAPCRSLRSSDRLNFARVIGGQLWVSSGPVARSTTNTTLKGPTIRVFDLASPGSVDNAASMASGSTTCTTEWTGAVTSATIDPFNTSRVLLGHEGGFVSMFDRQTLECQRVLKISATDILALEFVGDRLWAGTRTGYVNVYDISTMPWTTTNTWLAHQ